jgi:hypothetical protein
MNEPIIVSATAIRDAAYAALRVLSVLIGGFVALVGFIGHRDLNGLIAWVRSDDFLSVAGALVTAGSFGWGVWKTYRTKRRLVLVADAAPNHIAQVQAPGSPSVIPVAVLVPFAGMVLLAGGLAGCSTTGVRLDANKAFYTAQIALRSSQQITLTTCSSPRPALVEPCQKAIDLLGTAARAEAAGFTAQQAGNAADLQTALITLTALPQQLADLGVLEAQ